MTAASAGLDVPLSILKAIKGTGCPAFVWGKTYEAPLRAWIKSNGTQSEDDDYQSTEREKLADAASFAMWQKFEGAELVARARRQIEARQKAKA
jgi:hypothetical protein